MCLKIKFKLRGRHLNDETEKKKREEKEEKRSITSVNGKLSSSDQKITLLVFQISATNRALKIEVKVLIYRENA